MDKWIIVKIYIYLLFTVFLLSCNHTDSRISKTKVIDIKVTEEILNYEPYIQILFDTYCYENRTFLNNDSSILQLRFINEKHRDTLLYAESSSGFANKKLHLKYNKRIEVEQFIIDNITVQLLKKLDSKLMDIHSYITLKENKKTILIYNYERYFIGIVRSYIYNCDSTYEKWLRALNIYCEDNPKECLGYKRDFIERIILSCPDKEELKILPKLNS